MDHSVPRGRQGPLAVGHGCSTAVATPVAWAGPRFPVCPDSPTWLPATARNWGWNSSRSLSLELQGQTPLGTCGTPGATCALGFPNSCEVCTRTQTRVIITCPGSLATPPASLSQSWQGDPFHFSALQGHLGSARRANPYTWPWPCTLRLNPVAAGMVHLCPRGCSLIC